MENLSAVDEYKQDVSNVSTPIPGRTRFRALKLQHSRLDYARRKSATDLSSTEISCSEFSISPITFNEQPVNKTKSTSPSWFRRRFTLFSPEQSLSEISRNRQPLLAEKSFSDLLRHKRPSVIAQMMESFVRRLSSRKKKHHERQEDTTVIDPVYETLKIAAETRKRTIATYLQQRQQTLNKQTSLNSQGSSEIDTQPSPHVPRHSTPVDPSPMIRRQNARTEPELPRTASGKRKTLTRFSSVVEDHQLSIKRNPDDPYFY